MYRKNTAGQFICAQLLLTATGAVATGLTPTARRCIDGTFAAGGGTFTEDGTTGGYKYAMSQADTNGNNISIFVSATGAMPVCVNLVTTACDPTTAASFGITNIDAAITSRMASYTQPTGFLSATFPAGTVANTTNITAGVITTVTTVTNQLTAAQIATGIWQDTTAGDFTTALSVGKSVMNGVSLGTGLTINTVTNQLTAAAIATGVWTDTTAGDFTTALSVGKSVMNGVSLGTGLTVNDITTKTGYSLSAAQTFNLTGSITGSLSGSVGSVTGAVGSVTGAVGSVTGNIGGNVVGSVASVTARVTANVDQLNADATSAANIAKTTRAVGRGTASGVPTTTSIPTSACTPAGAAADQFKGRIITFDADTTTTALRGQATDITASTNAATPTFTCTALTTAAVSGDTFSIT